MCGDSHTSTHGAFGALAFGVGTTEVEHILATQTLVTTRSKNMRVQVDGELGVCVTSKDIILHTIGLIGTAGGTGMVIEFAGTTINQLSMESRMSLCNMSIEAGAKAGLIAPDETTCSYLQGRPLAPSSEWHSALAYWATLKSDVGAVFDRIVEIDAKDIVPTVSWGTSPEQVVPITSTVPDPNDFVHEGKGESCRRALQYMGLQPGMRMRDIRIDKAFIGSCTNARIEDIRSAARILNGKRISPNLKIAMAVPGSTTVKRTAEAEGLDIVFKKAGFEWREAGCSMCVGLNADKLMPFERCASTSNRNFEGRQGAGGRTHLMSPAMVAAAAIEGKLADVRSQVQTDVEECFGSTHVDISLGADLETFDSLQEIPATRTSTNVPMESSSRTGFQMVTGFAVPLDLSNVDTDCIMPVQFCKTVSRNGLGEGLFYNLRYDEASKERPEFVLNQARYQGASILLATGLNFGCGSSREHAVWALQDYGFRCILGPSFADIFYNNAFKSGLLLVKIECPAMLERIAAIVRSGRPIKVDLMQQKIFDDDGTDLGEFPIEEHRKYGLLHGLDDLDATMRQVDKISMFEEDRRLKRSWIEDSIRPLWTDKEKASKGAGVEALVEAVSRHASASTKLQW